MSKNPAAVKLGKLGGGGKHKPRTAEQYREQTRKANEATARKRAAEKAIASPAQLAKPDA